jgi:hypothetical protein
MSDAPHRAISAHYGIAPVPAHFTRWSEDPALSKFQRGIKAARNVSEAGAISYQAHTHVTASRLALMRAATVGRQPLLLFTSLRHPVSRLHSGYVQVACQDVVRSMDPDANQATMVVQCGGLGGGNATVLDIVRQKDTPESRWAYARRRSGNENYNVVKGAARNPQETFNQYDFIFVQERIKESVIAFMLQYGLKWEDVAVLAVKKRTGRFKSYAGARDLNNYILSKNKEELELWHLANLELDRKMQALQRRCGEMLRAALCTIGQLEAAVMRECSDPQAWYGRHNFTAPYARYEDQGVAPRCTEHVARRFAATGQL